MFRKFSIVVILFAVLCGTFCELNLSVLKGQTANIECAYGAENIFNAKYFFKMSAGRNIKSIYTLKGRRVMHDGRVSMSDDFQRKVLSISIYDVSESDSGLYACAVGKGHSLETFAVVRLSVLTAPQIVNIDKPSVLTVRPLLNPSSETTKSVKAVTEMSKEKEVFPVFSDWRWNALYVGSSILVLLSSGLILLICLKLRRRSMKNKRHKKSMGTDKSENDQKTENEYNKLDVCKCPDSVYHNLNKKQSDLIYQCLDNRKTFKH